MTHQFFNAHHSPIGSFSSFTLGYKGNKGGLGLEIGKPADQDIYIGFESIDNSHYNALPFFSESTDDTNRFDVENHGIENNNNLSEPLDIVPFKDHEISREFKLGSDTWTTQELEFTIYSQVTSIPEPNKDIKDVIIPAVFATLTLDNTQGNSDRRGFFGMNINDPYTSIRRFDDVSNGNYVGVGQGRNLGIMSATEGVTSATGFTLEKILTEPLVENHNTALGTVGTLLMTVPKGEKRTFSFVICFYKDNYVTTSLDTKYFYTTYFKNIEAVAIYALTNINTFISRCKSADDLYKHASLSSDQRFMLIHSIRSYYGSTEFLTYDNKPFWIVNEGEYRMINTFDLTVDQLFFEMQMNPWTVRNELDMFLTRYSYTDKVRFPNDTTEYPGGISFTHDMGVANALSRPGHSSYETCGIEGCFSHMTHEQLVNWVCCASVYVTQTKDSDWLDDNYQTFKDCFESMIHRDHPDPTQRNGMMSLDSTRVMGGAEITTYDSLDVSLGQARNNIYMAVKCWASYVALEKIFKDNKDTVLAAEAALQATRVANTLVSHVTEGQYIPAVLEKNNDSKIIPAIEGLIFPYFTDCKEALEINGTYGHLIRALKTHLNVILKKDVCLFDNGGWKLSSTSNNSWLSKIYLCQFVAREILDLPWKQAGQDADAAHVQWLLDPIESYHCWSDQMLNGVAFGSKYYPRGVTSILWLSENKSK